ncbi:error-prone DNA polymerase [Motiliproteus sp. SC1-56]|uniref:error-prone DNA polymerase n=1 Tax=Motiliproteus sp. SC1-56 TaxID=2799565 RepID=UPI001A8C8D21|nr:error-prone DNA polymerase [Motiliproteus sp. SC1-56]
MDYAELHCLSNFSFLRGASHPEELVARALALEYRALALTDECSVAGVVRAWEAARGTALQLIIGSEFRLEGETLVLLAPDRRAYAQLCTLISNARRRASKGSYQLEWQDFDPGSNLDHCLLLYRPSADLIRSEERLAWLANRFTGRCWLLIERLLDTAETGIDCLLALAARQGVSAVCANDVHMHHPDRQPLQDILSAIRLGTPVQQAGFALAANAERHLRSRNKLRHLYPRALREETLRIAARCRFCLSELRYEYPSELVPPGMSAGARLRALVEAGVRRRFPGGPEPRERQQIEHELLLIAQLKYEHYFLTIEDIVTFARRQGIFCQGRGSAANSIVCYCLGITEVDPRQVNLLVERFISTERNEPPDIDVDFEHTRREEVIQYIYAKYGRDRAGLAATVISYRPKSAIRDVGKALGMDESHLIWLISQLDRRHGDRPWLEQLRALGGAEPAPIHCLLVQRVEEILGFPRHLSQHVGGFIIAAGPLTELVPVENAAMAGRTVIQWNKDDLQSLGLLKVDILALGMLTAIRKTLHLLGKRGPGSIEAIPREDAATYEMLSRGDSMGVFQVESRAQMSMLPRLRPRCYYDLVVQVAIVRPGPIQGDMVHPYLQRRNGAEAVDYPNDAVRAVLEPTLGVPIFQEQVIRLAMVAAGFSGGEADRLRRAMAAWRRSGSIAGHQHKLRAGMEARGYSPAFAERICRQIEGFGEYGFPESHAASFALLVYVSAWLKRHHPAAFCAGLLNSQPMGFYAPAQLIQDARRHGVEVRPVCLNASHWDCTLEYPGGRENGAPALRLGLRLVRGFSEQGGRALVQARPPNGFVHLDDARHHCPLDRGDWDALAAAGALAELTGHRHQARWALLEPLPELALGPPDTSREPTASSPVQLPPPSERAELEADYRHLGLTLKRHPLALLRAEGQLNHCLQAASLARARDGQAVQVAGLVINRQQPGTAAGVTFVTLEDESGQINLVVWRATAQQQRRALLSARLLQVAGVLQRDAGVIHVVAGRLTDISHRWEQLKTRSRDFR